MLIFVLVFLPLAIPWPVIGVVALVLFPSSAVPDGTQENHSCQSVRSTEWRASAMQIVFVITVFVFVSYCDSERLLRN